MVFPTLRCIWSVLQNTGKESLLLKALPRKAVLEARGFKPSFSIKFKQRDRSPLTDVLIGRIGDHRQLGK